MIGYLVLLHLFVAVVVHARRPNTDYNIFEEILQNDANLNEGFDLDAYRQRQLNLDNYYRSLHEVPLMTLDNTLTSQAQEYAETLALNDNGLPHCNPPACDRHGAGENLARGGTDEKNATKDWYSEIRYYDFCSENGGRRPGYAGKDVGHFTQVVWKTSTLLGIGYARTSDKSKVYVVGRYKEHGNIRNHYKENVLVPSYILDTYQDNCDEHSGGLSSWSGAGECTQSCGGGVQLKTRTCTNPKPSFNGTDCAGPFKAIAVNEWCNKDSCTGDKSHRDLQCEARGKNPKGLEFKDQHCTLHCQPISGGDYLAAGLVDDGTHCKENTGACVAGVCESMPTYFPPANSEGQIVGQYTGTPSAGVFSNMFFEIPNGAADVVITNHAWNGVKIYVGYKVGNGMGYEWSESFVSSTGNPVYTKTRTTKGVTYVYKRTTSSSTFTFEGPVQPTAGYTIVLFAKGTVQANISWSYSAPTTA